MSRPLSVRRPRSGFLWRQLMTVLTAVGVIAAMIVIAQTARGEAERHQHVQVLVERVRGASEQMNVFIWLGMGSTWTRSGPGWINQAQLAQRGLAIYSELTDALKALRRADDGPLTMALVRDTNHLYTQGTQVLPAVMGGNERAKPGVQESMRLTFVALDRDSRGAAAQQQRAADQASTRAGVAYLGSLVIGLLLLVLLGFQLHRLRRRTLLSEQRRSIERRAEQRLGALVEHSSDIITVLAPDLTVRWQSPTVHKTLGYPAESFIGRRLTDLLNPADTQRVEGYIAAAIKKSGNVTFTARFRDANGDWRHLEAIAENRLTDPLIEGVVLNLRDITERKTLEDELRHQAFHDALTGLANRALFDDRLAHALAGARRRGLPVAVLFLDLDDFKTINDSLGHSSGDALLRAVAIRIATIVRVTDTAARLGGDEFAVLLEIMDDDGEAETIAGRLLEILEPPFQIAGRDLRISASIGVAKSDGSRGVDELLRNADTAMYVAKGAGKGTMRAFEEGMHQRVLDRLELTGELQRALQRGEFELDYQPIVDLQTGQINSTEALVRWAHPARGRLAPGQFIGLAEETGLIVPLGTWVLDSACAQAAIWQRTFPARVLNMNVNVSIRQLHDPSFPQIVAGALRDSGLAPERLVLEITESLLPEDSNEIIAQLHKLKALGVLIAVDDFGTGYSALSRLRAYPIDILKIDRSFIDGIELDAGKEQLVRGIVNLSESLQMSVVAEGIEEPEQADRLRQMRSPLGQGYVFSRPVTCHQLQALLESGKPLVPASSREPAESAMS
jgi:diguanylate cyclase (GGDEF)-like protein/PAS domain S-box-containing protein